MGSKPTANKGNREQAKWVLKVSERVASLPEGRYMIALTVGGDSSWSVISYDRLRIERSVYVAGPFVAEAYT